MDADRIATPIAARVVREGRELTIELVPAELEG